MDEITNISVEDSERRWVLGCDQTSLSRAKPER
jgi:hypothetical protein